MPHLLSTLPARAAAEPQTLDSIGTPTLWTLVIGAVVVLLAVDFLLTRRPHEVSMKEALAWSAFYVALPLAFAGYVFLDFGYDRGLEFPADA